MAVREFSFTSFQANNPTAPPPGDRLDGEFDRLAKTITALPPPAPARIGKNQLEPGLFDQIGAAVAARVEALAATAQTLLAQVHAAATGALAAAGIARAQNALAQDAAQKASAEAEAAAAAAEAAGVSADRADAFYVETGNAARDTAGDVATCQAYADVTYAWAEHMPDTIPPNILAVMGISGDHWSSRWWANRAAQIVQSPPPPPANLTTVSPATGATVVLSVFGLVLVNSAALAALTILLPPSPVSGNSVEISFLNPVNALSVRDSAGGLIVTAPPGAYGPGAALVFRFAGGVGWVYWK